MKRKTICIIGLGYIGLPTAAMFATHGHKIIGVDVNDYVITALNDARSIIEEPYLDILVQAAVKSGNLKAQKVPDEADVFIIAVPTPIKPNKTADMSFVIEATQSIVPHLRAGNVVVLESTSPPGTVDDIIVPILAESGLEIGEQVMVAHSPERVLPGRILIELVENNRIVGGINQRSAEVVKDLYKTFVKGEIYLTDAKTAEMCKIMENTYRDVNIAFANELAIISEKMGINVWDVIKLCNKHPRVNISQPGPGVGGHCIAVDPWFIVEKYPDETQIIALARRTNDSMPAHVTDRIDAILAPIDGPRKITILGVTYKQDVDDLRESPIIHLIELLQQRHDYQISIVDPHVKNSKFETEEFIDAARGSDLVVLGVQHKVFAELDFKSVAAVMRNKNILDTRNFLNGKELEDLGFQYYLLGQYKN
ncbi:MAG: nucleotide sugar dehydrogenase [Peptococcaceae bacterium]|nr:nucleotide sugar dehydrogenase [Peptococcaceae bacterium]